jgi:hypothetical protein
MSKISNVYIDIEVSPALAAIWRPGYNISVPHNAVLQEGQIITAAWQFNNSKTEGMMFDFKSDKKIVATIIDVMAEADQIIGQNHRRFDLKWIRTRALKHGLSMPPRYKTVDTLTLFKKYFNFASNKQDYVSKFLTGDGKLRTDFQLWLDILVNKDQMSLDYMLKYNKKDVKDLYVIYNKIKPYIESEMHVGVLNGHPKWTCATCGSYDVGHNKEYVTARGTIQHSMKCKKDSCRASYPISDKDYRDFLKAQKNDKS